MRDEAVPPRGKVHNFGPVAGTGVAITDIGAADLGEVVPLPDGSYVAVFGDAFGGTKMGTHPHYASVAVPVTFSDAGHPRFGAPLTGPVGSRRPLFRTPRVRAAKGTNTLPAGSIQVSGKVYMMVVGTVGLKPVGGSWLVEVTNNLSKGCKPIAGSWRPGDHANGGQSQISGYQHRDGKVYIVADSFDRSQGVTLYRADPDTVTDRSTWCPYVLNPNGTAAWGVPGHAGTPCSGPQQRFGELSFRDIDGQAVLAGFNSSAGLDRVEVRVAARPNEIFSDSQTTVVAQQHDRDADNYLPQNYGGYIMPGSTLDRLRLLVSQWNTTLNTPYNVHEFVVNAHRGNP